MVIFKITNAGLNAALDAQNNGLTVRLDKIKFGSGQYDVVDEDPRTSMVNPFLSADFIGGGTESNSHTLRFNCSFIDTQSRDVFEIGLFTDQNVLFAVASRTTTPFFKTSSTLKTVFVGGLKLGAFDSQSVVVVLQEDGALVLQLLGAHESHLNPHPQYAMLNALNNALARISFLENKVYEDIQIGDLFVTTKNFANGDEVTAHKKYGKWARFGEGRALVGISTQESDPLWTKEIGNTFGEMAHQLSIAEIPSHDHVDEGSPYNKLVASITDVSPVDGDGSGQTNPVGQASPAYNESYLQTSDITPAQYAEMRINSVGGNSAHNIVQPSIIIGAWQRIPETLQLVASKSAVSEGEQVTFTLITDFPLGTTVNWQILGIQSSDITPSALFGTLITDENGQASYTVDILYDGSTEGLEILRFGLINFPSVYCDVLIDDTSTTAELVINNTYGGIATIVDGYYVKPSINLYDFFLAKKGRAPNINEEISIVIESDVAIVGDSTSVSAIAVDNRWLSNSITLLNHGLILGRGGDPSWNNQNYNVNPPTGPVYDATNGGTAIESTYDNEIVIQNYGLIAGGGGGGGAAGTSDDKAVIAGGAGAPLGTFRSNKIFQENTNPTQATLQNGGVGGKLRYFGSNWWLGGNGGAVGENGKNGNAGGQSWINGGQAGLIFSGNVVINNIDSGQSKGRTA
ncbi:phage baseplate protein [Acinetobacter venetianus]|uniref:phage baseplate protein n=1 Tax=Acinetobacter venetianus TaxID=52133 RepID=UPI003A95741D